MDRTLKMVTEDMKKKAAKLDALCSLILAIPVFILNAWSLQLTWNWFAPAVWLEAPRLSFKQAVAAFLLSCWFRIGKSVEKPTEYNPMYQTNKVVKHVVNVFVALSISWLIHKVFFS